MTAAHPRALFLDRDGTLIRWVDYLCDPEQVELCPGVADALKRAKEWGCLLFLHTNQSGVGRGYFGMDAVERVNARMFQLMAVEESFFDGVCIATDKPDTAGPDSYRKPSARFAQEIQAQYGLAAEGCYYVGDSKSDVLAGLNAGMNAVWVIGKTVGRDLSERQAGENVFLFDSLEAFVRSW